MENIVTITLLYLTLLGNIEMTSFEIPSKESCESWYHHNVKVTEPKKRKMFTNHYYHEKGIGIKVRKDNYYLSYF
jgi:hypothetical protein